MTKLRKIFALALVLAILCVSNITAFATPTGSITVKDTNKDQVYKVYKIFDIESYDEDRGVYIYKCINDEAADFLRESVLSELLDVDSNGYVSWKLSDVDRDTEAKYLAYFLDLVVTEGAFTPDATQKSTADGSDIVFDNLPLGYYLIQTTTGGLCALTTTNPDAVVHDKNEAPTIKKYVGDLEVEQFSKTNNSFISGTNVFYLLIDSKAGAMNYRIHDVMDSGFDLLIQDGKLSNYMYAAYKISDDPDPMAAYDWDNIVQIPEEYYTITTDCADGCTFEVEFDGSLIEEMSIQSYIADVDISFMFAYGATLNDKAKISPLSNDNKTWLEYGEMVDTDDDGVPDSYSKTPEDKTQTYTYQIDIAKTDEFNNMLNGARFKVYSAATGGTEIEFYKISDGVYRLPMPGESTVNYLEGSHIEIKGIANLGVVYLEEIKQPLGYNILKNRVPVILTSSNNTCVIIDDVYQSGGVHVINKAGSLLPTTGNIGTTIFYVCGVVLVLGVSLFYISKRRLDLLSEDDLLFFNSLK
ncbi:MAG: hypothetical protein MJ089_06100 [Ruminococcus sp.]|nr:hypothetical protein [Ruminococcus sp.]